MFNLYPTLSHLLLIPRPSSGRSSHNRSPSPSIDFLSVNVCTKALPQYIHAARDKGFYASQILSQREALGASSRHPVFKKPKQFIVPVTPSAPTEGTADNFTKLWYFPGAPIV